MGFDAESGHKVTSSVVGSAGVSPTVSRIAFFRPAGVFVLRCFRSRSLRRGLHSCAARPFQPPYFQGLVTISNSTRTSSFTLTVPPPPLTGSIPKSRCFSSAVPR